MIIEWTITFGNLITLIGLMVSWAAGMYSLNRKSKERAEEMHHANNQRLTAVEQSLRRVEGEAGRIPELAESVSGLQGQVRTLLDFLYQNFDRRSWPR